MKLIFERSRTGCRSCLLPPCDVPHAAWETPLSAAPLRLPALSEVELTRHYNALEQQAYGVCDGFYPLGSCTMKYNPRINEQAAALPGFTDIHPLQPEETIQGSLELLARTQDMLCEITGMDAMTMQPAAGAHGEYTGLLLIRAYHTARGDNARRKILVPDSAHGTNPASAAMAGFEVISIPSNAQGGIDLDSLRQAVGPDTAGLMLTNPNTLGLFDPNILEITGIVHDAGGLCYYDGANLNAIMGIARPGDMGFDCVHVNLHKTFSTPHGGGGPGSGPVGCKAFLADFLPSPIVVHDADGFHLHTPPRSIGRVKSFYGNFLVAVRAFAYLLSLGRDGIPAAASAAVLNANYLKHKLEDVFCIAYPRTCMHEFVISLASLQRETGVSALDFAKRLLDFGMHPPTMYFPLIVHEALMIEPTETESRQTLDEAADVFRRVLQQARENPELLHSAPHNTPIGRPDEVEAARHPHVRYVWEDTHD